MMVVASYRILFVIALIRTYISLLFFFFNDTATTEIYTLSLHDALPIWSPGVRRHIVENGRAWVSEFHVDGFRVDRSEEHTSELQSQSNLVCRLLLEKKKKTKMHYTHSKTPSKLPILTPSYISSSAKSLH